MPVSWWCQFHSLLWLSSVDTVLWLFPHKLIKHLNGITSLPILMQESFWWWQCSVRQFPSPGISILSTDNKSNKWTKTITNTEKFSVNSTQSPTDYFPNCMTLSIHHSFFFCKQVSILLIMFSCSCMLIFFFSVNLLFDTLLLHCFNLWYIIELQM